MPGPTIVPRHTLTQAYKLVRQVLSTTTKSGLTTKDIVREGLALYDGPVSERTKADMGPDNVYRDGQLRKMPHGTDQSTLTTEERALHKWRKIKKKFQPEPQLVPEGHPFISTRFLKSNVLPTLSSLNLVAKHPVHADPSHPSTSTRFKGSGPTFLWSLVHENTPLDPKAPASDSKRPRFSSERQWDRLLGGAEPGQVHWTRQEYLADLAAKQRADDLRSGRERRTEEEIREWPNRKPGITTAPERAHLNKRRQGNRPEKEWRRLDKFEAAVVGKNGRERNVPIRWTTSYGKKGDLAEKPGKKKPVESSEEEKPVEASA